MIIAEFKSPFLSLRCQLSTVNCQLFKVQDAPAMSRSSKSKITLANALYNTTESKP
ncbi:MAG: hypothetical protein JGK01_28125 [Microcoleus sp. PH2017_03_ELD_O_A]|nr:hypothetical protein [Microcoleus sp. PH2017_04_SCI_O_A]MCC3445458.1 hypothetical protein [Microcoleus sp. PH2017_03_ELD_O_A]MCC3508606.1 hypothetical protein [Microcoleus sp. PH2017_17_BER_D_A]